MYGKWTRSLSALAAIAAATAFEVSPRPSRYGDSRTTSVSYFDEKMVDVSNDMIQGIVTVKPTLRLLKEWTQDYLDAVDVAEGSTRVDGYAKFLADDFVQTNPHFGPVNKEDYMKTMNYYRESGFDLGYAVPDLTPSYNGWHQDPHDPWRIWTVVRYEGTHAGIATVPSVSGDLELIPPNDSALISTGPEMQSFLWKPDKTLRWQTSGYVGDDYTGTNQGYGGLHGLMVSMGLPKMFLDVVKPMNKVQTWLSQFRGESNKENPRFQTPYSKLPQWWHDRKNLPMNIHS